MIFRFILFLWVFQVYSSIPNVDNEDRVYISTNGVAYFEISSNPSTGYWWTIQEFASEKFSVDDYDGEYQEPLSDLDGAGSTQLFCLKCNSLCQESDEFSLTLNLKRSWEEYPIQTKTLRILVSNEPRIQ